MMSNLLKSLSFIRLFRIGHRSRKSHRETALFHELHIQSKPSGFSLLEIIIAVSIVGIVSALSVPLLHRYIGDAKVSRAQSDIATFAQALEQFYEHTRTYPGKNNSRDVLNSSGTPPQYADDSGNVIWGVADADVIRLGDILINNTDAYTAWDNDLGLGWRGPYIEQDSSDPWGYQYWVGVQGFANKSSVWVISAGKDGIVSTAINATELHGNDIGRRLR